MTVAAQPTPAATTSDRAIGGRSTLEGRSRGLVGLPDRIVYIACAVFVVAGTLATFRVMFWWLFVPLLAIVLILTWRFMPQTVEVGRRHRNGAIAAAALALVWFLVQIPLVSQFVVPTRDPGIYAIVGAGIAHTGGSPIDITQANHLVTVVNGLTASLGPFGSYGASNIELQGSNGVPAILSIGFWLGGVEGELLVNLLVGAISLLALYALARRFMGPYWALLPSFILGLAMPFIYFARTTYSEDMAVLLLIAASIWIVSAFNTKRISDFAISGALAGASGLTRIDGALEFIGMLVGLALVLIGIGRASSDSRLRRNAIAFVLAGWIMLGIGIFDLLHNNPRYVSDLGSNPKQLWGAAVAAAVVVVILGLTPLGSRSFSLPRVGRILGWIVGIGLAIFSVVLLARPWFLVDHHVPPGPTANAIAALQAQDGLAIDPTRGYSEYSLWWFGWYFGWAFLVLAIVGISFWAKWAINRGNAAQVVLIATAGVVAVLYLPSIKITPDQIWAFRRVLPVLTPTLVLAAVFAIRWLWKSRRRWLHVVAIVAIVGCAFGTLIPWGKIMFTPEEGGQAAEIEQICAQVGHDHLVAMVDQDAPANYAPTIREYCNAQVVTVTDVSTFDWKSLAANAHEPVAVVTFNSQVVNWVKDPSTPTHTAVITTWTRDLLQPPRTSTIAVRSVFVGQLQSDGLIRFSRN